MSGVRDTRAGFSRAFAGAATRLEGGRRGPGGGRSGRGRSGGGRSGGNDLRGRIVVSLPLIALALFLVSEGGAVFVAGVFVLGCLSLHELYRMYEHLHPVRLAGFLALAGLLAGASYGGRGDVLLAAVAALPVLFALTLAQPRHNVAGMAITLLGIYWIGLALAHAVLLRELPHGAGIVIDVLVGTFLGDTGAYLGGRLFGKRPLAPAVSPNKTVEGLLIGMACAVASVWVASRYQSWLPGTHALVLGIGVAVLAPVGDLFESFVKREASVKDASHLLGAHGGVLDRLDAVLFSAVVGYYIWLAYV